MANRPALADLGIFNETPTTYNASRLIAIPVLFDVLNEEAQRGKPYPQPLLDICKWIHARGLFILSRLLEHDVPLGKITAIEGRDDWETVSTINHKHNM